MGRKANDGRGRIGGRAKGTKNKPTEPLNAWVSGIINRRRAQFERDLDALNPEQRADVMGRLIAATTAGNVATVLPDNLNSVQDGNAG